jgi:hypothetical protein
MDRQLNAGLNIGMTALRETKELGGLRLALDALPQDVVRPLYASEGRLRDAQVERRTGKGTISAVRPLGGAVE